MTYKIGQVLTTPAEAWKALAEGAKHRNPNGAISTLLGLGLYAWDHIDKQWLAVHTIDQGPWTIVADPSKLAKPERKQLSFDEAYELLKAGKDFILEFPGGELYYPSQRTFFTDVPLLQVACDRGWPIYAVEGE